MYDVQCDGLEDSLMSCNFRSDNSDSDSLSCNNAYVICQGTYNNNYYNNNNNYNGGKLTSFVSAVYYKSLYMFMLCFAIIIIIIFVFPLHVHCIHLVRGMMCMRIPSSLS